MIVRVVVMNRGRIVSGGNSGYRLGIRPWSHPDIPDKKLRNELLDLLHTDKGMPSCGDYKCSWYWRKKYPPHQF